MAQYPNYRTAACTVVLLAAAAASADPAAIERCRLEADAAARIACLETALGGDDAAPAEQAEPRPAPPDAVPPAPPEPLMQDLPPVTPETRPQVEVPLGEPDAAGEAGKDESAAATASARPEQPAAGSAASGAEIGAEQVKSANQREAELQRASGLRVARYKQVPFRRLEVHLENGQVWRQINGDTQEVRASMRKNQTVDIEESSLGGYKLRLNEMQRTIRVRRVE